MWARLDNWLHDKSKSLSRQGLYKFLSSEYAKIPRDSEVLSIGAGGKVNELLEDFSKRLEFQVTSFDIDESLKPNIVGDICDYDFANRKFDVVVLSEVLEHLHSPHLGLKNIHSILKENGILILTTPFVLPMHERPHDYFRFTRYGLEFLLKDFRSVQIRERNSYFDAIDVLWVRLLQTALPSARLASCIIIPVIFGIKRPITRLLNRFIRTDAMTTGYVVTAIK